MNGIKQILVDGCGWLYVYDEANKDSLRFSEVFDSIKMEYNGNEDRYNCYRNGNVVRHCNPRYVVSVDYFE